MYILSEYSTTSWLDPELCLIKLTSSNSGPVYWIHVHNGSQDGVQSYHRK